MERVIASLSEEIALLEQQVEQTLRARPAECERAARLRTAPGVGPKTSWALVAELPELGQLTGRRRIAGGRAAVRKAMSLLSG